MDKLKAIRGGHRSAATRLINRTDEKISQNEIQQHELNTAKETLEKKRDILQQLDSQILEITEVEGMEQEMLDTDDYTLNLETAICRYTELKGLKTPNNSTQPLVSPSPYSPINITANDPSTSTADFNTNHIDQIENVPTAHASTNLRSHFYHRLPKLELPSFTGDILSWKIFWESFETTVHLNPSLTNIQKFSYLKAQIHNEAERCISGLSLTAANYEQAITLLKERFGQEQTIIHAYMHKLLELPNPTMNPHSLRLFHDTMETSIRGLESLGQSQDSFGSLLVPIIFGKLPLEMRRNMTRGHGKRNWDIRSLREAISMEMYVQETGSHNFCNDLTPTVSFHIGAMTKSRIDDKKGENDNHKPKHGNSCVFCRESHYPSECKKVVTVENRHALIKQKRLCFNCFGNNKIAVCTSKHTCRHCNRKHHTSLCKYKHNSLTTHQDISTVKSRRNNNDINMQTSTLSMSNTKTTHQRSDVLLKTAVAPVSAGNDYVTTNILLDEGSQKSFITQDLARKLNLKPSGVVTLSLGAFGDANRNVRNLDKASVDLQTYNGNSISMEVLIVPTIAAPLYNHTHRIAAKLPYLQDLKLAHPISEDDNFEIDMLLGADNYWNIVGNGTIRGPGPTAVDSKLGYLLPGPMINKRTF